MTIDWDGKSPAEAARKIIADCKKANGKLDEPSLQHAIEEIVLAVYKAQGRTLKFKDIHTCEETTGMIGDAYIRCGASAKILVQPRGRTEGPYWMCDSCASHNIMNRDCENVTPCGRNNGENR